MSGVQIICQLLGTYCLQEAIKDLCLLGSSAHPERAKVQLVREKKKRTVTGKTNVSSTLQYKLHKVLKGFLACSLEE